MAVQLPSYIIIMVFLLVLINIIITFPILRKFKVATPIFRPLFAWQMNRTLLWIYMIVLVCVMFAMKPSIFQSIVLNFEVVLSLLMYIQGLSLIHFFERPNDYRCGIYIINGRGDSDFTLYAYRIITWRT